MNAILRPLALLCCLLPALTCGAGEEVVEIRVSGKQPGPPMWRVRNGERELYIFALVDYIPEGMVWESDRVEAVIARSGALIGMPEADLDPPALVMLNPLNLVRGYRLARRVSRHPDGETLRETLPEDLYRRYGLLRQRYFPDNDKLEKLRPLVASGRMRRIVLEAEKLVAAEEVSKKLRRLMKRNRQADYREVVARHKLEGGFGDLAGRAETLMESLSPEHELQCFEARLQSLERDVDEMKYRADSWARGYIDEFRGIPLPGDDEDPCLQLLFSSSERELFRQMETELRDSWLAAAENALRTHDTSFAVLGIVALLSEDGLLAELKARGYEIREP